MRQHPREAVVNEARQEISKALIEAGEIEFRDLYSMVFAAMAMVIENYPYAVERMTMSAESGESYVSFIQTFERARTEHQLTEGECMRILAEELASLAKYEIRQERHPEDPSKPGGLE